MKCFVISLSAVVGFASCSQSYQTIPQTDPGGPPVNYGRGAELPRNLKPNDATISLYNDKRLNFIETRRLQGRLYTIEAKGNSEEFTYIPNEVSLPLETELSQGYLLSYIFFDDGVIRYDGRAADNRLRQQIDDEMLFYTHSIGKSITSYIIGHAICEGYIGSIDEPIDWPMMENTLYQNQPLLDLLNMRAGDEYTIDTDTSAYVMGSPYHHRDMGLDTISMLLEGTQKRGRSLLYNNFLTDVIANYIVYKSGENYDALMRKIFQDKVKIGHSVSYEKHGNSMAENQSQYYGDPQTLASYSYFMTRLDFLRVAEAMMKDYQEQTCVGQYLKLIQIRAEPWFLNRINSKDAQMWTNNYAQEYGGQFYFKFRGMISRNIFGAEGYNGQNMLIDMDNSRIIITNSAAQAWDAKLLVLDVIKSGQLPN